MKRLLMAFTAVAALAGPLAAPVEALAQERGSERGQSRGDRPSGERRGGGPRFEGGERPSISPQQRHTPPPRQGEGRPQGERPQGDRSRGERPSPRPDQARPDGQRPDRGGREDARRFERPDYRGSPPNPDRNRPGQSDNPYRHRDDWSADRNRGDFNRDRRPDRHPDRPRGDYNRDHDRRGDHARPNRPGSGYDRGNRNRHEDFRRNFNRDHWRRDFNRSHRSGWWRNDHRFRGYTGVRVGFYFAPGFGYYSVPRNYWGQRWSYGQYLPSIFWRYQLNDWRTYGLGFPPPGTRWVLVDNAIYLIDEYDGFIIEVIYDAWSW